MPVSVVLDGFGPVASLGGVRLVPEAGVVSEATVEVSVLSQAQAVAAGVKGVLFTVVPSRDLGAPVELSLGYGPFSGAFGAAWGSRLRLVRFPSCLLTTPSVPSCREFAEVAGAVNDSGSASVMAPVDLVAGEGGGSSLESASAFSGGGGGVFSLMGAGASENGNFGATSLNQSLAWSQGGSGGDFSTSLSVKTPPVAGGPVPQLGLQYSSGSVDGLTESTNNQANVAGVGWSMTGVSYIERSYRPCVHDGVPGNQGDLCFVGFAPLSIVLNGQSSRILADTGNGQLYAEDLSLGWRVQRLLNAGNGVWDGEYFKVTTMDATEYYFGSRDRAAGGGAARVAVFGNDPGEPCYSASGFGVSGCTNMGYKWHLDKVIDRYGHTMTYNWDHYVNRYGAVNNLSMIDYDASTRLISIEYGTLPNLAAGEGKARAEFGYTYRCTDPSATVCENNSGAAYWPDTPWDQYCAPVVSASCAGRTSPTFWTIYRLDNIASKVKNALGVWEQVDALALNHTYPATGDFVSPAGDDTAPALWLNFGYYPNSLLAIETSGVRLANRVAWGSGQPAGLQAPMMHYRLNAFSDATGGLVNITYSGAECTSGTTGSILKDQNNKRCYPVWEGGAWRWYHKYVVTDVENRDRTGGSPSVWTHYEYTTEHVGSTAGQGYANALWRFDYNYLLPIAQRTYSQWRGYPVVYTRVGDPAGTGIQKVSQDVYFRGMSDPWTGRAIVVTDGTTNYDDGEGLTGKLLRHTVFDGRTGPWRSMSINQYSATNSATQIIASGLPTIKAWRVDHTRTIAKLAATPTYVRTSEIAYTYDTTYPLVNTVQDLGETAIYNGTTTTPGAGSADDVCTANTYIAPDTTRWLIGMPKESTVTNCAGTPAAADYLGGTRHYYDSSTTLGVLTGDGNVTETRALKKATSVPPAAGDWIATKATYDHHGRVLTSTDAENRTSSVAYTPALGTPVSQTTATNPAGWTTSSTLDIRFGVPTLVTDVNGTTTRAAYDGFGRIVDVWKNNRLTTDVPDAHYQYVIRNTQPSYVGTKLFNVAGTGQMTESFQLLDSFMRPRRTETPGATGTGRMINDTVYGPAGEVARTSTFYNSSAPSAGFDTFNEASAPQHTRFGYNNFAEQTLTQPYTMGSPLGSTWNTVSTHNGRTSTMIPPQGGTVTSTVTNARGKTIELRQYEGASPTGTNALTSYSYDRVGNLVGVTDPALNQWQYWYDLLGRKTKTSDPDAGISETTYFNDGAVQSTKDALNQQLWYAYDNLGRKTSLKADTASGTTLSSWTYDTAVFHGGSTPVKGQLASSTRPSTLGNFVSTVASYNRAYQPTSTTFTAPGFGTSGGTLTYTTTATYNVNGTVNTTSAPAVGGLSAETLTSTYNTAGLPERVTGLAGETYVDATTYDHDGLWSFQRWGNSPRRVDLYRHFEAATRRVIDEMTYRENAVTAGVYNDNSELLYTYDPAANIKAIDSELNGTAAGKECFTYDHLRRLTQAWTQTNATSCTTPQRSGPDAYRFEWTFDSIGNRTQQKDINSAGVATTTTYNSGLTFGGKPHQLKSVTAAGQPTRNFTYDAAGNTDLRTTETGVAQDLNWDKEGHLATLTDTSGTTSYIYGVDGQRLVATTPTKSTLYLPDGTELEKLTSGGSVLGQRYLAGVAVRDAAGLKWMVKNHQGTAITQIDKMAMTVNVRRSLPYGEPRGAQPAWLGTKGYIGGTKDNTGLTHLGAREYDPTLGRFISVDPIMDMADPQQWHAYTYSDGSPVTFSDPTGLRKGPADLSGGGGGGGAPIAVFLSLVRNAIRSAKTVRELAGVAGAALGQAMRQIRASYPGLPSPLTATKILPIPVGDGTYLYPDGSIRDESGRIVFAGRPSKTGLNVKDEVFEFRKSGMVGAKRTIAGAELNVNGQPELYLAASGENDAFESDGLTPPVGPKNPSRYNATATGQNLRENDAEYKLFTFIANRLGPPSQINGTLYLYSENKLCISCSSVYQQFQAEFPNIQITIVTG
jgi:RHS repeat-associated protein